MPNRRARLRRETVADIKAAALTHLQQVGPADLSLRAIARDLEMSAPGLYRYFDGRDALLTALIADGYHDLANHLHAAVTGDDHVDVGRELGTIPRVVPPDAPIPERLVAVSLAYRRWAVDHPLEFGLLFGTPVPGYAAPADGPTTVAMGRVGAAFLTPLVEAALRGQLRSDDDADLSPATVRGLEGLHDSVPSEVPATALSTILTAWGRVHGSVSLEVFGHWHWLLDDAEDLFRADLRRMVDDLGLTQA